MKDHAIVIVSGLIDATIKEYQPDVEFKIFKGLTQLGKYLETDTIRAKYLYITADVISAANTNFSYLYSLTNNNQFFKVDSVQYITTENAPELNTLNYLIEEYSLTNWNIIIGNLTRAYVTNIINGTQHKDTYDVKRKAVYRIPKSEYVKQQMRANETLDDKYDADDALLADIPDVDIPIEQTYAKHESLERIIIAGDNGSERTAFAFLAAQYFALTSKTVILECDSEFHTLTEYATKSEIDCLLITVSELYNDVAKVLQRIKDTEKKLIVIGCIDRIPIPYQFLCNLLFYNLNGYVHYLVTEMSIEAVPPNTNVIVTVPSTVIGCLQVGTQLDASRVPYCRFVGVNLKELPETHIGNGQQMSTILQDILVNTSIVCPIITVSSLRLNGTAYDLGAVLNVR